MTPRFPTRLRAGAAAVAAASAALLAGCGTMIPAYERPAPPVAPSFPQDAAAATGSVPAADIEWQRFFGDERLRRLIEIALANNRDLRVAILNIEQARATYQVRRADQLPTVGAAVQAQRQPGANGELSTTYAAGLSMSSYELDFFGRVRSLTEVAQRQFLATEEARRTTQISLVAAVANGYFALLADDELLRVTQQTLATREDSFRLTKLKFDNGAASELDFRQAESLLEGARVSLAQAQRQRMLDENALVLLLGQSLPPDLPAGLPLTGGQLLADIPAGLPSELLTRRPDVRQAEQQLLAANANIGAARAAMFPNISLTASFGSASTQLGDLFKAGSFAWTGTAQLLQPIFNSGRNRANVEIAQASRDIAVAQYEKAIQSAFREVADALAGRATLTEQARAQLAQARAAEITYRLSDLRYRNGAASYLDVLDAQRTLFQAQQAVVQIQATQVQNQVALYKALGGGWKEPAAQ